MAKGHHKIGPGGHKGAEPDQSEVRWLISYSDFMMQLVCLFILLYSVSSIDAAKAAALQEAWKEQQGINEPKVQQNRVDASAVPLTIEERPQIMDRIRTELGRFPEGRHFRIIETADGFRIQFPYAMFDEGTANLTFEGRKVLDIAALVLKPYERRVALMEVVGHTAPDIREQQDGSAMKLSLSRSRQAILWVSREESSHPLEVARLAAAGRGPHDPLDDNTQGTSRSFNRRVDFTVHLFSKRE